MKPKEFARGTMSFRLNDRNHSSVSSNRVAASGKKAILVRMSLPWATWTLVPLLCGDSMVLISAFLAEKEDQDR